MIDHDHPSIVLEGIYPETHQAFFQPSNNAGIVELANWWFDKNMHGQWCVFHFTSPIINYHLWHFHRITDDRLRFYHRERELKLAPDEQELRQRLLDKLFADDQV